MARGTEGFVWVGLQEPSLGEVEAIAGQFDLPALAVEDAVKAHQRPKLEVYDDILFAVFKPVRYVDSDEVVRCSGDCDLRRTTFRCLRKARRVRGS